jgi:hypothetical protein
LALVHFFIYFYHHTKRCREAVIAAGVEEAQNVEGEAPVDTVVVPQEAEVVAGMSHSRSSTIQTHGFPASLQRDNPLLSTLAFPTLLRTN